MRINAERRELENNIEKELQKLSDISEDAKIKKNNEVKELIQYYHEMTSEIESRRGDMYDFTLQYVVILLTALGVVLAYQTDLAKWSILLIALLATHILFSIALLVVHEFQSQFHYPFLDLYKYGNKWKWFYYANPYILKMCNRVILPCARFDETQKPYLKGLEQFINEYRTERIDQALADNIQQLYLLQVHNYYKNQFFLRLVRIRLWMLRCSAFVILVWVLLLVMGLI
jgi:hypothetical protein